MTPWYQIRASTSDVVDLAITGDIDASTAPAFLRSLPSTARTIRLYVASLGGDAAAALQIAQVLKGHPARVEVTLGPIAASAASLPPCCANHVTVASDTVVMIHAPRLVPNDKTPLTARRLRDAAGELGRVSNRMADVYAWRLKGGRAAAAKLVDDEQGVWLDARECISSGLADAIRAPTATKITAHFNPADLARLGQPPARFRDRIAALARSATAPGVGVLDATKIYEHRNRPGLSILEIYDAFNRRGATR